MNAYNHILTFYFFIFHLDNWINFIMPLILVDFYRVVIKNFFCIVSHCLYPSLFESKWKFNVDCLTTTCYVISKQNSTFVLSISELFIFIKNHLIMVIFAKLSSFFYCEVIDLFSMNCLLFVISTWILVFSITYFLILCKSINNMY